MGSVGILVVACQTEIIINCTMYAHAEKCSGASFLHATPMPDADRQACRILAGSAHAGVCKVSEGHLYMIQEGCGTELSLTGLLGDGCLQLYAPSWDLISPRHVYHDEC